MRNKFLIRARPSAPADRPAWLRVDRLLGEWGIPKDSTAGRRHFAERMEHRRHEELAAEFKTVERGWYLGGEDFRQELLAQMDTPANPSHFGPAAQENEAARAERMVTAGLRRQGWNEADLQTRPKGDTHKVALARELRRQTTMPMAWIATRLHMGTRGYLAWLLGPSGKSAKTTNRRTT